MWRLSERPAGILGLALLAACSSASPRNELGMNRNTCDVTVQRTLGVGDTSSLGFDAETLASELRVQVQGAGNWTADPGVEVALSLEVGFGEPVTAEEITYDAGNCMRVPYDEVYVRVQVPYAMTGTVGGDALSSFGVAELWARGVDLGEVAMRAMDDQVVEVDPALVDTLEELETHETPPFHFVAWGPASDQLGLPDLADGWLQASSDPDAEEGFIAFRWEGAEVGAP